MFTRKKRAEEQNPWAIAIIKAPFIATVNMLKKST